MQDEKRLSAAVRAVCATSSPQQTNSQHLFFIREAVVTTKYSMRVCVRACECVKTYELIHSE